ncbi:hypothetical protein D3C78_944740 [compost metagenome]
MIRMAGQTGIIDRLHQGFDAEVLGQRAGTALLLTHAQHQGFHAANDHVGGERVERRTVDFPVMTHLGHQ